MSAAPLSAADEQLSLKSIKFNQFGDAQTQLMERITGPPAVQLVNLAGIVGAASSASSEPVKVLDVCSGAGVVIDVLLKALEGKTDKVKVVSTDLEAAMVELAKKRGEQQGWTNVETKAADGTALPFEDASFDFVLCSFGPQFFPDLEKGVAEAARVLTPGGTYAYTAWTSPGFVPYLLKADPSLTLPLSAPFSKPIAQRAALPALLSGGGFDGDNAKVEDVKVPFAFEGTEHFIETMKMFPGPLFTSEERCEKVKEALREDFGEKPFTLDWVGLAVSVQKRA